MTENQKLLAWAQKMFDTFTGDMENQLRLALIIATCLQTEALTKGEPPHVQS